MPKVVYTPAKGLYQQSGTNVGSAMMAFIPDVAPDSITNNGAISVSSYFTSISTAGGPKLYTLAAGSVAGQLKKLLMAVDGGDATLTIINPVSTDTDQITFNDVGDTVELMWNGSAWRIIASYNVADGTAPAVVIG
jgi:hypothetical protein